MEKATTVAGISRTTLWKWLAEGRRAQADLEAGVDVPPDRLVFVQLLEAVRQARAEWEGEMLEGIAEAAEDRVGDGGKVVRGDWKARAWLLERICRNTYAPAAPRGGAEKLTPQEILRRAKDRIRELEAEAMEAAALGATGDES